MIELVTTDGIFRLDGGEWEVTNNIWLVGDEREVAVFDAAHDHQPLVGDDFARLCLRLLLLGQCAVRRGGIDGRNGG